MAALVLGIDIGTTSTKVVLVDPGSPGVVSEASLPVDLASPFAGWAEADPARWWANVCALVPRVLTTGRAGAADIAAVATTGMVPAVVTVGGDLEPLRAAILQNDARAGAEVGALAADLGDLDLVALTGSALTQQSVAPTLSWLAQHEPDTWAAARHVLGSYDWLAVKLGAPVHVERNWALESGLYALESGALLEPVLAAAALDSAVLPPPAASGTLVGAVSTAAAVDTGLRVGTPIVVGGADHVLSAYAAGLAAPGDWLVKLGGAGDILVVTDHPFVDARLYLDAHPQPGLWLPNGCMATSGSVIRWLQTVTGTASTQLLEAEAAASRPAQLICLPYFLGEKSPVHDPDLRGAFLGLHLGHRRGDLYRAVLEGIAYGFRHHADVFAERGVKLGNARITNGGSKSGVWKQILADVLDVPLSPVREHPGASLGAAFVAAVGVGLLKDWAAAAALVRTGDPVEPDPALRDRYREAYQLYRAAGDALAPISHLLASRSN